MRHKGFLWAGLVGIAELAGLQVASAEPPRLTATAALSHDAKGQEHGLTTRLDLRAPSLLLPADRTDEEVSTRHLSAREALFRNDQADTAQSGHIMSPLQNVAHNFRQEGLPIAKLFQSNTSLVHVGLNPKGKPGLWIIHKVH